MLNSDETGKRRTKSLGLQQGREQGRLEPGCHSGGGEESQNFEKEMQGGRRCERDELVDNLVMQAHLAVEEEPGTAVSGPSWEVQQVPSPAPRPSSPCWTASHTTGPLLGTPPPQRTPATCQRWVLQIVLHSRSLVGVPATLRLPSAV